MRKLVLAVGVLAVLGVAALGGFYIYEIAGSDDPNLATSAPTIVVPASAPGTSTTPAAGATQTATLANGVHHFVVDSSQSSVKYVVKEVLRGVADVTTVGTTTAITGDVYVSTQGLAATPKSTFKVDLTKLATDQSMRDASVRQNTLQTNRFPTAEFTIDSVTGFPTGYIEGSEVRLTLTGTLTIHGVSKSVTWQVLTRQASDTLTATADTDIKMTDYGMTPPDVGFAKSEDAVHLQVVFVSKRAAG